MLCEGANPACDTGPPCRRTSSTSDESGTFVPISGPALLIGKAGLGLSLTFNLIGISLLGLEGAAYAVIGTRAVILILKAGILRRAWLKTLENML